MGSCSVTNTILLFVVVGSFLKASLGATSNENDSFWLLKIQSQFNDSMGVFRNWSPSSSMCTWNGIQCSDDQTHVVGMNLSNTGLSGSISPDISHLVSLQKIDLSMNYLTGLIPPELGQLQDLQELLLFSNYLSGHIPVELSHLKMLQVLRLGDNQLTGEMMENIGELTELRVLALAYCQLNGSIPSQIGNLKQLKSLHLQANNFGGTIPKEISGCQELEDFAASNNRLEGEVPSSMGQLKSLEILNLANNTLSGSIPSELSGLSNLKYLNFLGNRLSGEIPLEIVQLPQLQNLDLSSNNLSGNISLLDFNGNNNLEALALSGLIMDYNQQLALITIMYTYLRYVRSRKGKRKRVNTSSTSGHQFTLELLQGNDRQCIELLRMSRGSFIRLCTHFRVREWLKDGKHVSVEEKMAMFFMMIGHNQRYVVIKNRFQHSTQTIHKFFHEVLAKMVVFAKEIIIPTNFNLIPNVPNHNRRLRRIFKGAVGALDGTLIHACVPKNKQQLYRGRGKGECYQNVLGICDFNMMFTFLVAGWEGIAHDSRILSEAIRNLNAPFPLPPPGEFRQRRALNTKEKFNHSHAKLRNVIERAYGVLKARFPILKRMPPFSLITQRNITIACFALHNFIRKEGLDDELFATYDQLNVQLDNENVLVEDDEGIEDQVVQPQGNESDREYMTNLRDQIATQSMQGS